jgi:cell division protein FtsW (lipid II flippase)
MGKFKWTDKDRFMLCLSLLAGLSSGIISGVVVSTSYAFSQNPNQSNFIDYAIVWIIMGIIIILLILKINKYEKMIK